MPNPDRTRTVVLALAWVLSASMLSAQTTAQTSPRVPAASSRPLDTFGAQLLHNVKATFTSKRNLLPLAVGGGASAVTSIWDSDVQEHFGSERRAKVVGDIGQWMGGAMVLGGMSGGVLLIGYNSDNHKLRRVGYDLSQTFILAQGMTQAVKFAVRRERPNGEDRRSFVSGHSSGSFAMAVVVAHHYPKARIPVYTLAGFVAFSRIEKNKHWLSDTVAGATLGAIVGMTVVREDMKPSVGRVTLSPHIPLSGGIGVTASLKL